MRRLDALDDLGPLALELGGVRFVGFLLALDEGRESARKSSEYGSESVRPTSHHSMESLLTSSRLLHLWSSSNRWLLQKWPSQKPQSPEMRWAGSLHSLNSQRGFLTGMLADFACVRVCCAGTSVCLQESDVTLRSRARRSWSGAAAVGVRGKKRRRDGREEGGKKSRTAGLVGVLYG